QHPQVALSKGGEGDPAALRHRLRARAYARRDRPGVRRHARTHPADRSQGAAATAVAGAGATPQGFARRALIAFGSRRILIRESELDRMIADILRPARNQIRKTAAIIRK